MQLSIIIPHHNSLDQLKRLLRTIPINSSIVVIIVDDRSPQKIKTKLCNHILTISNAKVFNVTKS